MGSLLETRIDGTEAVREDTQGTRPLSFVKSPQRTSGIDTPIFDIHAPMLWVEEVRQTINGRHRLHDDHRRSQAVLVHSGLTLSSSQKGPCQRELSTHYLIHNLQSAGKVQSVEFDVSHPWVSLHKIRMYRRLRWGFEWSSGHIPIHAWMLLMWGNHQLHLWD